MYEKEPVLSPFEFSFVDRPQFVHVIRLIGATAGIVEAEHAGDQQSGLVVCHRVGPGEYAAGLAVKPFAVGEEQAVLGRELATDATTLSDEGLATASRRR